MSAPRILIAEDDDLTLELLSKVLGREGYETVAVSDGGTALQRLRREKFDLVVTDVQMARASGREILEEMSRTQPQLPVVMITAYAEPGAAMDAISLGAADYLGKPVDVNALRATVQRALLRSRAPREAIDDRAGLDTPKQLIGTSPPMLALYKQVAQVAPTQATILITGEPGSGKELVARTIAERSTRKTFLSIDCAALSETALEVELFGHERGAFGEAKVGLFELANGGTLFLDEISEMSLKLQAQLLRVLDEGTVRRVGGTSSLPVDVRVIAATHRDLEADVHERRFRSDLYYRLNVANLRVPTLRERGEHDLVQLAQHLIAYHARAFGRPVPQLSEAARQLLVQHTWSGNVRELENALARAVAMTPASVLLPTDLPAALSGASAPNAAQLLDADWPTLEQLERRYIDRVLNKTGGNKTAAASVLGVDRRTLQRLFKSDKPA